MNLKDVEKEMKAVCGLTLTMADVKLWRSVISSELKKIEKLKKYYDKFENCEQGHESYANRRALLDYVEKFIYKP